MSDHADKPSESEETASADSSGRFLIGEGPAGTQPPPPPAAALSKRSSKVPPPAPAGAAARAALLRPDQVSAPGLADLVSELAPVTTADSDERAEIDLEDLSLRLDNPYAASSLVPPPRQPFAWRKAVGVGAGGTLVAGGLMVAWSIISAQPAGVASAPAVATHAASKAVAAPETVRPAPPAPASTAEVPPAPEVVGAAEAEVTPEPATVTPAAVEVVRAVAIPAAKPVPATKPAPATERVPATEPALGAAPMLAATAKPAADAAPPEAPQVAPEAVVAAEAPVEVLPEMPTREQVQAGFEQVRPALQKCAADKHGVAKVNATIAASGRIAYALVGGAFKGTPEGSCMARALRKARFPKFSRDKLKVSLPFTF